MRIQILINALSPHPPTQPPPLKSAIQLKESEITLTIGIQIQVPLTKTEIQYLESEIHGVKF